MSDVESDVESDVDSTRAIIGYNSVIIVNDNVENNGSITNIDDLLADLLDHSEEPVTIYGTKYFSDLL